MTDYATSDSIDQLTKEVLEIRKLGQIYVDFLIAKYEHEHGLSYSKAEKRFVMKTFGYR